MKAVLGYVTDFFCLVPDQATPVSPVKYDRQQ